MNNIESVNVSTHASKSWLRFKDYGFTNKDIVCSIVLDEVAQACLYLPIGFIAENENYSLVTIQGLKPNQNLFLGQDGAWNAAYIPARYRAHPFLLGSNEHGESILCVDSSSNLILPSSNGGGERFFDDQNKPSEATQEIIEFLTKLQTSHISTDKICNQLKEHGLIEDWPIFLTLKDSQQHVKGLFRISEEKLHSLTPTAFTELRDSGALTLVYCQLLSMQHLKYLVSLQAKQSHHMPITSTSNSSVLNLTNESLDFSNL